MPCFSQKLAFGVALGAVAACGIATVPAAPTVVGEVAVWAALVATAAAAVAAASALADCLDDNNRHQDAETLRREIDNLRREMDQLQQHAPAH